MLVTPKAGFVTVVGVVVVGSEQLGTAGPEVVAGDAVDDASVAAAGVGPEKGEAVAAALVAAALVVGPAKLVAVAVVAAAAAAIVPSSAVAAVGSENKIITLGYHNSPWSASLDPTKLGISEMSTAFRKTCLHGLS